MNPITHNAIIKKASLTIEDHGCLTAWITLDYGGSGQGFGGYNLCSTGPNADYRFNYAGKFIVRVLQVAGREKWEDLPGASIRVKSSSTDQIVAIGHLLADDWFLPGDDLKLKEEAPEENTDGEDIDHAEYSMRPDR
tara:strand:+ start:922 stop:1332 length:411 start_codon:yes stop_codon:yes gene_type:complete